MLWLRLHDAALAATHSTTERKRHSIGTWISLKMN